MASQKRMIQEWEQVLRETQEHETELADLVALREALQLAHARTLNTRGMRDTLQTSARDASRRLREAFAEGRQAAASLRGLVKSRRRAR